MNMKSDSTMVHDIIANLNYTSNWKSNVLYGEQNSISGEMLTDRYSKALVQISELYSLQVAHNQISREDVSDYEEMLSCANYLDNRDHYANIDQVLPYSHSLFENAVNELSNTEVKGLGN